MFCKNCGDKIHDGAKFCQRCGTPAPVVQPVQQASGESAVSQPAPLHQLQPVQCPACGMLMFPERRHCLICDKDLSNASELEQNQGKDEQTVTE